MVMNFGHGEGMKWDDIFKAEEGKAFFNDYVNTICPSDESLRWFKFKQLGP
jgi:alpha-ribazole phosphatase